METPMHVPDRPCQRKTASSRSRSNGAVEIGCQSIVGLSGHTVSETLIEIKVAGA